MKRASEKQGEKKKEQTNSRFPDAFSRPRMTNAYFAHESWQLGVQKMSLLTFEKLEIVGWGRDAPDSLHSRIFLAFPLRLVRLAKRQEKEPK